MNPKIYSAFEKWLFANDGTILAPPDSYFRHAYEYWVSVGCENTDIVLGELNWLNHFDDYIQQDLRT